jgi:tetratricopeptide (TPR) repeat protein
MKTITFYSYKGGVGRSLALANIATRLAEVGKRVCVMDFDLDAPGLQFKFPDYQLAAPIEHGLVDYIYDFATDNPTGVSLTDCSVTFQPLNSSFQEITFIPAGNIESGDYWKKLSMIPWSQFFYAEEAEGIDFFLDLKAQIIETFNPDVLLIDSRTGITDISAITLKIFADEVVVLAANNNENLFGCKRILKNLYDPEQSLFGVRPKINFVLTRLPFSDSIEDNEKQLEIVGRVQDEMIEALGVDDFEFLLIHSNKSLEIQEQKLIGYEYEKGVSISNDYLKLFDILTPEILDSHEMLRFNSIRSAEKEYAKGQKEKDNVDKIRYFSTAIQYNDRQSKFFKVRAYVYSQMKYWNEAIDDYKKVIELEDNASNWNFNIGYCYYRKGEFTTALNYFEQSVQLGALVYTVAIYYEMGNLDQALNLTNFILATIPEHADALNARANIYRRSANFELAYKDIFKALELSPENPAYFATLAEIYASQNKLDEFYLTFSVALSFKLKLDNIISEKEVYKRFVDEDKFITLFAIHNLDLEELKQTL